MVGTILGPHGVRGEVRVDIETDVPERFVAGAALDCDGLGVLTIASIRQGPRATLVRFDGYDSREAAESLHGRALRVSVAEARRAAGERYLWADLVGLRAEDPAGAVLGSVTDVLRAGETDVLVVRTAGGKELLLPALGSVLRSVDLAGGRVVVSPQEELA